jgi:hypothetical protein
MTRLRRLTGLILIVCGCLSLAAPARADAVTVWNAIASQAIATATAAGRPGPTTFLDFAMVQVAVYDAVQAIEGRYKPYHVVIPGASGSPAAAAAKAAHDVLLKLFPAQAEFLDKAYHGYLASNGLAEDDPGVAVGQQAAAVIIALRANDGSFPVPAPPPFTGGTDPGVWRPTPSFLPGPPPSLAPMAAPWLGTVLPYTLNCPAQFRASPPPALTSRRYARDYNEVKALGALFNSDRTPEQTDLAYFWADNFAVQWNRALRAIADAHIDKIGDTARLFALANMAMADSIITSWDSKNHYANWRPVTAIQEGDNDGNWRTAGDPDWQPLFNTPPYPDHTSGANNVTGAVTGILALFFGRDRFTFEVTSNHPNAVLKTRTYKRFSDAAEDVVNARIYLGIHFRFADTAARRQGRQVAKWAFTHFLRPVHNDDHDDDHDDDEKDDDDHKD